MNTPSAKSRVDPPVGRWLSLYDVKIIIQIWRRLALSILHLLHFHVLQPNSSRPNNAGPNSASSIYRTQKETYVSFPLQVLHRFRYRYIQRNPYQHRHMILINRTCINRHFLTLGYFSQQLSATIALHPCPALRIDISSSTQDGIYNPKLYGFLSYSFSFPKLNARSIIRRLKARGFTDPRSATLNRSATVKRP